MTSVLANIDAQIAELQRLVQPPEAPLFYGSDIACAFDCDPNMREVDPASVEAIGQDVIKRLTCPRGRMPDDGTYGLDLRGFCNRGVPYAELFALGGQVRLEVVKDDRIDDVAVTVTVPNQASNALRTGLVITPAEPTLQPFELVFVLTGDGALTVEAMG